jgi:hypothetical protein
MEPSNPLGSIGTEEDLAIAHRQWMRANRMRDYFSATLGKDDQISEDPAQFYLE